MAICDTHMHIYDGRYRSNPYVTLHPADALVEHYRDVQAAQELERVVVVQPTTYGLDNSCQLDAMAAFGDAARGVMVVDHRTTKDEIRRLHGLGVRGARFQLLPGGAIGLDALEPVAALVAAFGWHLQIQLNGHALPIFEERLLSLGCPLVFDHVGRFMPAVGAEHRASAALFRLVDAGAHVKLSAPYESQTDPSQTYDTVTEVIDALVARAPDRMLWATNWPHPGRTDAPSHEQSVALRERWLPTAELRQQVLIDNPARLYEF